MQHIYAENFDLDVISQFVQLAPTRKAIRSAIHQLCAYAYATDPVSIVINLSVEDY